MDAVTWASGLQLGTSTEVRDAAASKLTADAKKQGITITNSIINLLIELAVQAVIKQNIPLPQ
jgi:hypothetical protein